jgi:hypothetical protein
VTPTTGPNLPIPNVRELATLGKLAQVVAELSRDDLRILHADAYLIVTPVVFQNHTRRLEIARRHHTCARSFQSLEPDCLDRFHDDLEAVIDYLFRHAIKPIENLEGWVTRRLRAATVDGYRRRRGAIGALQRPRLPAWLATELGHEPRLTTLALQMLQWVGIDRTAGTSQWPLEVWTDRRAQETGDYDRACRAVTDDVEKVLAAMRRRPTWFANFVERPLGRKQAPVAIRSYPDATMPEPRYVVQATHQDLVEAHVLEVVGAALDAIERRIGQGEDPYAVVSGALTTAFNSGTGVEELDDLPASAADMSAAVARSVADPDTLDRIVAVVLDLLAPRSA